MVKMNIANWEKKGKRSFRSFSPLAKEEIMKIVLEEYKVTQKEVKVFAASDLFWGTPYLRF